MCSVHVQLFTVALADNLQMKADVPPQPVQTTETLDDKLHAFYRSDIISKVSANSIHVRKSQRDLEATTSGSFNLP